MRNIKQVLSTGCFFLCLGGWVYSGQLKAEDQAKKLPFMDIKYLAPRNGEGTYE